MPQLALSFEKQKEAQSILKEIMGSNIMRLFECMTVAEEIIDEFKQEYPQKKEQIHDAFQYMRPSKYLKNTPVKIYRIHATEILQRIVDGQDLKPATDAELLIAFSEVSLKVPMHAEPATTYIRLAKKHFPEVVDLKYEYESYPGSIEETYQELRKKMATSRTEIETNKG